MAPGARGPRSGFSPGGSASARPLQHSCPRSPRGSTGPRLHARRLRHLAELPESAPRDGRCPAGPCCPSQLWQCGWGGHCPWSGSLPKAVWGGRCPHLPQHPSWLGVRVPLEPSLSPGATLQGGLCPLLRASGRERGRPRRWQASGEPERGADGGCDRGADGSPPPGGRCAERRGRCFQGRREPGARGSSGRAAPHGGRCTVGASLVSDSWSRQRDTRFPSVGGPQPPALSWPLCLSRPPWPSPPPFPATSHTRASGFHTGRLGRPCRARAGPARGPAGPRLSGLHAPQNPCSPEGPARRDCPQGTPRDVWGRLWLSHWGRIWHGVGGAGGAAQPPQCPGRPQRTRLPL